MGVKVAFFATGSAVDLARGERAVVSFDI